MTDKLTPQQKKQVLEDLKANPAVITFLSMGKDYLETALSVFIADRTDATRNANTSSNGNIKFYQDSATEIEGYLLGLAKKIPGTSTDRLTDLNRIIEEEIGVQAAAISQQTNTTGIDAASATTIPAAALQVSASASVAHPPAKPATRIVVNLNDYGIQEPNIANDPEIKFIDAMTEALNGIAAADKSNPKVIAETIKGVQLAKEADAKTPTHLSAINTDAGRMMATYKTNADGDQKAIDEAKARGTVLTGTFTFSADQIVADLANRRKTAVEALSGSINQRATDAIDADAGHAKAFFEGVGTSLKKYELKTRDSFTDRVGSDTLGVDSGSTHKFDEKKFDSDPNFSQIKSQAIRTEIINEMRGLYNLADSQRSNATEGGSANAASPYSIVEAKRAAIQEEVLKEIEEAKKSYVIVKPQIDKALSAANVTEIDAHLHGLKDDAARAKFFEKVNGLVNDKKNPITFEVVKNEKNEVVAGVSIPSKVLRLSDIGVTATGDANRPLTKSEIELLQKLSGRVQRVNGPDNINAAADAANMITAIAENLNATEKRAGKEDKKYDKALRNDPELHRLISENPELSGKIRRWNDEKLDSAVPSKVGADRGGNGIK